MADPFTMKGAGRSPAIKSFFLQLVSFFLSKLWFHSCSSSFCTIMFVCGGLTSSETNANSKTLLSTTTGGTSTCVSMYCLRWLSAHNEENPHNRPNDGCCRLSFWKRQVALPDFSDSVSDVTCSVKSESNIFLRVRSNCKYGTKKILSLPPVDLVGICCCCT